MNVQEVVTYAIVGIATVFTVKTVIRQFTSRETSCPKCSHCGPKQRAPVQQPDSLIQIEVKEGCD